MTEWKSFSVNKINAFQGPIPDSSDNYQTPHDMKQMWPVVEGGKQQESIPSRGTWSL